MRIHYILLRERVASKKEKGLLRNQPQDSNTHVLEGSLWYRPVSDYERDDAYCAVSTLQSVEFDGVYLPDCDLSTDVKVLQRDDFELLYALTTCSERIKIYKDKQWMEQGRLIQVNSVVHYITTLGVTESRIPGKVRYKGVLPSQNGMWFGVELSAVSVCCLVENAIVFCTCGIVRCY